MELKIASFVLVPPGESIFSEDAISVSVDDEGGGPFIVVAQDGPDGKFRVDFAEWELLSEGVQRLREAWDVQPKEVV